MANLRKKGWNEQVVDEQGRRRFHGAFTGGFSAGYYNSVGSKEGWTPSTFVSSRNARNPIKKQTPQDFMDEEDDPLLGKEVVASTKFDTLNEKSKEQLTKSIQQQMSQREQQHDTNWMASQLVKELVVVKETSIGKQLLQLMGWKEGQGIGPKRKIQARGQNGQLQQVYVAPKSTLKTEDFPVPKLDDYGIGFDPFKNAPEFRKHFSARAQAKDAQRKIVKFSQALGSQPAADALNYGLGALEEPEEADVYEHPTTEMYDKVLGPEAAVPDNQRRQDLDPKRSFRLCQDGKKPLSGFHVGNPQEPQQFLNLIQVPQEFNPRKFQVPVPNTKLYAKYHFAEGQARRLTATDRGQMLGETPVVRKSIFALLSEGDKAKLQHAAKASSASATRPGLNHSELKAGMSAAIQNRFTSSGDKESDPSAVLKTEVLAKKPREEYTWKPEKLLCKRFGIPQPVSSKRETVQESEKKSMHAAEIAALPKPQETHVPKAASVPSIAKLEEESIEAIGDIERPSVDLFKAIFEPSSESDDSEDELNEKRADAVGGQVPAVSTEVEQRPHDMGHESISTTTKDNLREPQTSTIEEAPQLMEQATNLSSRGKLKSSISERMSESAYKRERSPERTSKSNRDSRREKSRKRKKSSKSSKHGRDNKSKDRHHSRGSKSKRHDRRSRSRERR